MAYWEVHMTEIGKLLRSFPGGAQTPIPILKSSYSLHPFTKKVHSTKSGSTTII